MTSPDSHRRKLAQLKSSESKLRRDEGKYTGDASKKKGEAARKRTSARRASSASTRERYEREAAKLEEQAATLTDKAAAVGRKIAINLEHQRQEQDRLRRAESSTQRQRDREDGRRQTKEKAHVREVARLAQPTVRYTYEVRHIPAPQPEKLRVAYLTANPRVLDIDSEANEVIETRIRVDKEIHDVREQVKRALFRDYIEISYWPAAMPEDLLNSLNDERPHVVHFSGHGGGKVLEFDDGEIDDPQSADVTFDQLTAVLAATDQPPRVLVLNACDTLDGAEVLLNAVPVIIATAEDIADVAANLFAVRFYAAIAAGQSVHSAIEQARAMIDMLPGESGDMIQPLVRDDVELADLVLVKPPTPDLDTAI